MREFARVCVEINDGGEVAKRLEGVLNAEVAVADPKKTGPVYGP